MADVLFHPAGDGPWRAVMQLGGAEGGMHQDDAALLAAHGFTVLALAYFGMPGLPPTLRSIPVEYFGRSLDYLRAHPKVTPGGITVMGVSKGSEAALAAGEPFSIGWAFPDLANPPEAGPAMISVDRIRGPVLLLSAGDDGDTARPTTR
jgi:dienelactone hydrolase